MQIVLVGLNHRSAPVEIRERLALTTSELASLMAELSGASAEAPPILAEAAILSTCNRFEVYGLAGQGDRATAEVRARLAARGRLPPGDLEPYLLCVEGAEAVRHLFAVAAGLDSMILGEPQILGQVADAYQSALGCGAAGRVLAALFRQAIRCGRRARNETAIGEHAVSIGHAAVELARRIFGSLGDRRVLLIGAGEMAELAARNLSNNGARQILVVNRSQGRAEVLARRVGGLACGWDRLGEALAQADVVICSAAAPHSIIRPDQVRAAMALRQRQPLFLIDIAVPRNVEPAVAKMHNVYLYDVDDLQSVVQEHLAQRQREVPRVAGIVEQCSAEFWQWFHGLDVAATIRDLRAAVEQLGDMETERTLRRLGPLSKRQERVVRAMGHNIVSKLLHGPTVRLKQLAAEDNACQPASLVRELFGLAGAGPGKGHD